MADVTILFVSVGLTTGIFILIARLLLVERPVVTIIPSKHRLDLRFQNRSKHSIVLLSIHSWPRWVWIARDDTPEGIAAAAEHQIFSIVLQPWEILNFPIVIQHGQIVGGVGAIRNMRQLAKDRLNLAATGAEDHFPIRSNAQAVSRPNIVTALSFWSVLRHRCAAELPSGHGSHPAGVGVEPWRLPACA